MQFKDLFKSEDCVVGSTELLSCYWHYFGDILAIHDSIGKLLLVVNAWGRPVFCYTVHAGHNVGEKYLFPTLQHLQPVTQEEFDLYVKGEQ